MPERPTSLERAFDLARSGDYPSVSEIKDQLRKEGLEIRQIEGMALRRQLRKLCEAARRSADD